MRHFYKKNPPKASFLNKKTAPPDRCPKELLFFAVATLPRRKDDDIRIPDADRFLPYFFPGDILGDMSREVRHEDSDHFRLSLGEIKQIDILGSAIHPKIGLRARPGRQQLLGAVTTPHQKSDVIKSEITSNESADRGTCETNTHPADSFRGKPVHALVIHVPRETFRFFPTGLFLYLGRIAFGSLLSMDQDFDLETGLRILLETERIGDEKLESFIHIELGLFPAPRR